MSCSSTGGPLQSTARVKAPAEEGGGSAALRVIDGTGLQASCLQGSLDDICISTEL